jgi:hypothetical protein
VVVASLLAIREDVDSRPLLRGNGQDEKGKLG